MQSFQQIASQGGASGGMMQQLGQTNNNNAQNQSNSGIQLFPRFIFGVKGDVKSNLFYLDDQRVLYPSGHNVIIYNIDEKNQVYIPGVEGSEGITAMTVSPSKKYVAICEKSERVNKSIYQPQIFQKLNLMDISGISANPVVQPKRKKVHKLLQTADYNAKEFISVD